MSNNLKCHIQTSLFLALRLLVITVGEKEEMGNVGLLDFSVKPFINKIKGI